MSKTTATKTKALLQAWLEAKVAEDAAKNKRIDIEAELSTRPEIEIKPDGAKTITIDEFKCETKGSIRYSLDNDRWEEIRGSIPENLWPVEYKPSLNNSKTKKLKESPDLWMIASEAITTKPGKPGFKVSKVV